MTLSTIILAARLWTAVADVRDVHPPDVVGAVPVMVVHAAERAGVCPRLAIAVMWRESRGKPKARNGSHLGPMQVSVRWQCKGAPGCGADVYTHVSHGTHALARYVRRYGVQMGVQAYSCGPSNRHACGWYADDVMPVYRMLLEVAR